MGQPLINPVLERWELSLPVFSRAELQGRWRVQLDPFHRAGVLKPTIAAGDWWCDECCETHEIVYHDFPDGRHGYVLCRYGSMRLPREQTDRLNIDTAALLRWLFADSRLSIEPIVGNRLWNIGRRTIESRSRDLRFIRGTGPSCNEEIVHNLSTHPKSIVFAPSRGSASFWQSRIPCVVIAIEEVLVQTEPKAIVDWTVIEEFFINYHAGVEEPAKPRKKRGMRTSKIERLRDELKRHLASAADHAIATAESDGGIDLLPRPTKTELAKLAGMTKYDVTRCFTDPAATELRLLWDTAGNLEAVLRLRGRSNLAK